MDVQVRPKFQLALSFNPLSICLYNNSLFALLQAQLLQRINFTFFAQKRSKYFLGGLFEYLYYQSVQSSKKLGHKIKFVVCTINRITLPKFCFLNHLLTMQYLYDLMQFTVSIEASSQNPKIVINLYLFILTGSKEMFGDT